MWYKMFSLCRWYLSVRLPLHVDLIGDQWNILALQAPLEVALAFVRIHLVRKPLWIISVCGGLHF